MRRVIFTFIEHIFFVLFVSPPNHTRHATVSEWDGDTLEISRISRLDMGAYLCIASNGVHPSVSKRIKVSVDCEYSLNYFFNTFQAMYWPYF